MRLRVGACSVEREVARGGMAATGVLVTSMRERAQDLQSRFLR